MGAFFTRSVLKLSVTGLKKQKKRALQPRAAPSNHEHFKDENEQLSFV
jgi:hypothetical protein